jgi:hypothetical protein
MLKLCCPEWWEGALRQEVLQQIADKGDSIDMTYPFGIHFCPARLAARAQGQVISFIRLNYACLYDFCLSAILGKMLIMGRVSHGRIWDLPMRPYDANATKHIILPSFTLSNLAAFAIYRGFAASRFALFLMKLNVCLIYGYIFYCAHTNS